MKGETILMSKRIESDIYGVIEIRLEYKKNDKEFVELTGIQGYYRICASNTGLGNHWFITSLNYFKAFKSKNVAIKRYNQMDKKFMYKPYYSKDVETY